MFYIRFEFFFLKNEQIAHFCSLPLFRWVMWVNRSFCSNKMSDVSDSLRSLRGNERSWANCSGHWPKMSKWVNRSFFWANWPFAYFWTKNQQFAWKSNELIPSPDYRTNYVTKKLVLTFEVFWRIKRAFCKICSFTFYWAKENPHCPKNNMNLLSKTKSWMKCIQQYCRCLGQKTRHIP